MKRLFIIITGVIFLVLIVAGGIYARFYMGSAKKALLSSKSINAAKQEDKDLHKGTVLKNDFVEKGKKEGVIKEETAAEVEGYLAQLKEICQKTDSIEGALFASKEILRSLAGAGRQALPYIIENSYDKNNDWKLRFLLLAALPSIKESKDSEEVVKLLNDITDDLSDKEDVRINAVRVLRTINDSNSYLIVKKIIDNDKEPIGLKINALTTLSVLNGENSIPVLIDQLRGDKDEHLQLSAIVSLERLKAKEVIPVLIEALKRQEEGDYGEVIKMREVLALGSIGTGNNAAENEIINILNNADEKIDVRIAAAEALGNFKNKIATDALLAALQDKHGLMRIKSAESLAKTGDKETIDKLRDFLKKETDDFVKGRIERCLEELR